MVSEFSADIKGFGWFVSRDRNRLYRAFAVSSRVLISKSI